MSESLVIGRLKIFAAVLARLIAGTAFAVAGLAKCIDPYGFIYKIEDYLAVWNLSVLPSLEVVAAFGISIGEFCIGIMLVLGCYRRVAAWLLAMTMAVMLPLTAYIMIADPVADCGCFGDFIIISNTATFWKNVLLSVAAVILILWNRRVLSLIKSAFQWIALFVTIGFAFAIGYIGYIYQPLIDFRPYPVGTLLAADENDENEGDDNDEYVFLYTRDGVTKEFSIDSLPDDSWEFVDRISSGETKIKDNSFEIFAEDGSEVSREVITSDGDMLLIMIPDVSGLGLSRSHLIRGFNNVMENLGGEMNVIISGDKTGEWSDRAGAGLNIYQADDTKIKEMVRGEIGLVYLHNGVISWKLDATCLPTDYLDNVPLNSENPLGRLAVDNKKWFMSLTSIYVCIIIVLGLLPWIFTEIFHRATDSRVGESEHDGI